MELRVGLQRKVGTVYGVESSCSVESRCVICGLRYRFLWEAGTMKQECGGADAQRVHACGMHSTWVRRVRAKVEAGFLSRAA